MNRAAIINGVGLGLICYTLSCAKLDVTDWQYWTVIITAMVVMVNSLMNR